MVRQAAGRAQGHRTLALTDSSIYLATPNESFISVSMHNVDPQTAPAHLPIAQRWQRVRAAYRVCNVATHHVLGFTVKLALLIYFAFAITFLMLRYAILPNIDYYKGSIEQIASRAVGNKVSIARIYASWHGLNPSLFLGDVVLRDKEGRQVLALPSVSGTVSWLSVVTGQARFKSLEIIRPDLDVRRSADGHLYVAGVLLQESGGDGGDADWALKQQRIVIREGRVQWTDQKRGAPVLALQNVNMVLLNRWHHHKFALHATPPASLAAPLDIRANFTHPRFARRMADVRQWNGELYANLADTDLAGWKAYLDYPFQVDRGRGAVRAWLSLDHARLAGFTADVGLVDVSARLGRGLPPLDLVRVSGRLSASEPANARQREGTPAFGANGHRITLTDFSLQTTDGLALAPTTLTEIYTPAQGAALERVEISARELNLETLAQLARQLPMQADKRAMLADFAPRGRLHDVAAQWSGTYPALAAYRVRARFEGLGIKPQAARLAQAGSAAMPASPGFSNLSGMVDATDQGGLINLESRQLVLQLPAWFADPAMALDQFGMRARWSFLPQDQLLLQLDSLDFAQGALKGSLAGTHQMPLVRQPGQSAGVADLKGRIDGFAIDSIERFLPLQTPPELRAWLTGALEGGTAEDVSVRLRGDLAQFPFKADTAAERGRGEFRIAGKIKEGRLNYAPGRFGADGKAPLWPQAERINGSFAFDRTRMEIHGDTARTGGVGLTNVKAVIPDLSNHDGILEIDGNAAGPMQEFLRYVAVSPVLGWIGRFTEDTRASGNARLALKLRLPLHHMVEAKVQGALQMLGNDVHLLPDLPPLQSAIGKIEFNEHGVALTGVGASFLGGPLALTGGTQRDNAIVIRMSGTVAADGVRRQYASAAIQPVVGRLSGATRYSGAITVRDHQLQITLDSTLAGLGLDFPAPLNKAAADSLPLHFTLGGLAAPDGLARDELRLSLGSTVAARYLRERATGGAWKVTRGGIGVNLPAPEPETGMMVNVAMKSLNVDQWAAIGSAISGAAPEPAAAAAAATAGAEGGAATAGLALAQYVVPEIMAANVAELIVGERKLDNVVVGTSHQKGVWQASIDARQIAGHLTWNESSSGGLGKVTARLASLIIPESAAADVKDLLEGSKSAASSIPALDIVAERFELFNKQLGRLDLVANNTMAAAGREWRINRLSLVNPDGNLSSTGKWVIRDGKSSTSLNFSLDIADAGKLLDRFGFPETLRRGKGKMSGDIAWNGLPYSLDIPSLSGAIALNVAAGQFLKQDPGAAKLLGVLSLQMLPRLLKLDFHDVFSEGLAFDGISADATITRGLLRTDNLKMHGVAATVLMSGTADIANESTNLRVVVIPEFNLGTGPLVYALAVNPVVGLGSFLAQLFLRAPVMKALTYEMQVTGPWKAPIITKLGGARATAAPAKPKQ